MIPPDKVKQTAKSKAKENKEFFNYLKKKNDQEIDSHFHTSHYEIFEKINCLTCANCCKTTSPIFYQKDIERASKSLKIKPGNFVETYLKIDEENDFVLKSAPCPFLDSGNLCKIYASRPNACREYPHTNRKKVKQLLNLTTNNLEICPAVFEIVEKIKNKVNFPLAFR